MKLYPFADDGRETALALLIEGFPKRRAEYWTTGLDRVLAHARRFSPGRAGYFMDYRGAPAGVMLTLESPEAFGGRRRVNLSSWYVTEQARWLAPKMLADITSRPELSFTDLTASPSARKLNEHLGFRVASDSARIVPLLAAALLPTRGGRVVPVSRQAPSDNPLDRVLADHAGFGAVSMYLADGDGDMPLVVMPTPGPAPIGRVLLAPEPNRIARHIGPIARHLLRRGLLFLEIEASAGRDLAVAFETRRRCRNYLKGPEPAGPGIDHTYSELAVLPP